MTSSATPRGAADDWLARFGAVFGVESLDLQLRFAEPTRDGKASFLYQQFVNGLPVEGGVVRLLVQDFGRHRVTWAFARVGDPGTNGLATPTVTSANAANIAASHALARGLTSWDSPILVVVHESSQFASSSLTPAWKCVGLDALTLFGSSLHVLR